MDNELVRMENIVKTYGQVEALNNVTISVNEREIVGLVGDNGAGKTTLIKVLSGATRATSGTIHFKGRPVSFSNPRDAIAQGIETIYQDSALVTQLCISRNLFLGREPARNVGFLQMLDRKLMSDESRILLQQVGITRHIAPLTRITALSGGERQSVSVARAMFFEADLIILDEPTNNLGAEQTQRVLRFVKQAKADGHSSIFITHNIYHIFQVVDRIVVLRQGEKVGDLKREDTTIEEVEKLITGMTDIMFPKSA